jgi:hypothetical protein
MEKSQPSRFVVPMGTSSPASTLPPAALANHDVLRHFIAKVGGLANARAALELLALLENAPRDAGRKAA